jgi:hypothetical protein
VEMKAYESGMVALRHDVRRPQPLLHCNSRRSETPTRVTDLPKCGDASANGVKTNSAKFGVTSPRHRNRLSDGTSRTVSLRAFGYGGTHRRTFGIAVRRPLPRGKGADNHSV